MNDNPKKKILVVDDDEQICQLLSQYLRNYEFEVVTETKSTEAISVWKTHKPDLVVLDVMMPEINGFDICKSLRKLSDVPVIILTARGETTDKIVGLEIGADDYLAKPFEPRELLARVNSILRRSSAKEKSGSDTNNILKCGIFTVNIQDRRVYKKEEELFLTSAQFELLVLLMKHHTEILNRDQLMENIRGIEWDSMNRSVDVLVSRLRKKIGDDSRNPHFVKTVWGSGYIFTGYEQGQESDAVH